ACDILRTSMLQTKSPAPVASRVFVAMAAPGRPARCAAMLCMALALWLKPALGHGEHVPGPAAPGDSPYRSLSAGSCQEPTLACARSATPYFDPDGALWLAWAAGGAISVARSTDMGVTFGARTQIATHPGTLDTGPDARPQIVVDGKGNLVIAYGFFRDKQWNAQVNISTSHDHGKTFSPPVPVSADLASQRFPSLSVDSSDRIFLTWIDKRLVAAATRSGQKKAGGSIATAWSTDGASTFTSERIAYDDSCECCRIAVALDGGGMPVMVFRAIFPGSVRDHAVLDFAGPSTPALAHRVAIDNWKTDACPHHGPALAVSGAGTYHVAWFTQGQARQGTFYARSQDRGLHFTSPRPVGNPTAQPGRAALLARGAHVWLAWKEFDGKRASILLQESTDDGLTWSAPGKVAEVTGYSDHPLLVAQAGKVYLSWLTTANGYRLIEVGRTP
ncbi:MAG: sialidase family protein, partial [Burkholderiales bacterium]